MSLNTPQSGRLIALEGIDAAGKSTQAKLLAAKIGAEATFQFGATALGAELRRILLDPDGTDIDPAAEALMIAADKAQHVFEMVAPALRSGRHVVSDRFTASTLAYQGYGRGIPIDALDTLMQFAVRDCEPHLNILLDISPAEARRRRDATGDRFESAGADFTTRVRDGYLKIASARPASWVVVDASGTVDEVAGLVLSVVRDRLADFV